jgi:hypothetical protein
LDVMGAFKTPGKEERATVEGAHPGNREKVSGGDRVLSRGSGKRAPQVACQSFMLPGRERTETSFLIFRTCGKVWGQNQTAGQHSLCALKPGEVWGVGNMGHGGPSGSQYKGRTQSHKSQHLRFGLTQTQPNHVLSHSPPGLASWHHGCPPDSLARLQEKGK